MAVVAGIAVVSGPAASESFPGANSKIAFTRLDVAADVLTW